MPKSFTAADQVFLLVLSNVFQLTRSASSLQSKQRWPKQKGKSLHGLSPAFSNLVVEHVEPQVVPELKTPEPVGTFLPRG